MDNDQPRYFTLFDLAWEVVHVGLVATGCFVGWKIGGNIAALFVGGIIGRIVTLIVAHRVWLWANRIERTEE